MSKPDNDEITEIQLKTMQRIRDFGYAVILVTKVDFEEKETPESMKYGGLSKYKSGTDSAGFLYTVGRRAKNAPDIFVWLGSPDNHSGYTTQDISSQITFIENVIEQEAMTLDATNALNQQEIGKYSFCMFDGISDNNNHSFLICDDPDEIVRATSLMEFCKAFYQEQQFPVIVLKPV